MGGEFFMLRVAEVYAKKRELSLLVVLILARAIIQILIQTVKQANNDIGHRALCH